MRRRWKIALGAASATLVLGGLFGWWYADRTIIARGAEQAGFEAWQRGDNELAEKRYSAAIRKFPARSHNSARAHVFRARNRFTLKMYDEALADAEYALQIEPDNPLALESRGAALCKKGRYLEAAADLDRSLSLDSKSPVGHYYRGLAAERQGELDLADQHYNSCLLRNEAFARAYSGLSRVKRAQGFDEYADLLAKRARELKPDIDLEE